MRDRIGVVRTELRARRSGSAATSPWRKVKGKEFFWRDTDLPGFGLRAFAAGSKSWFVQFRQRGKQKRITLGRLPELGADEARVLARAQLAKAALDGLPAGPKRKGMRSDAPLFRGYAPRFWADYARHWKPSTRKVSPAPVIVPFAGSPAGQPSITDATAAAQSALPGARLAWIETPLADGGTFCLRVRVAGDPSHRFPHSFVWIGSFNGQIVAMQDGSAAGLFGRFLVALSGLLPLILFATGIMRWRSRIGTRR